MAGPMAGLLLLCAVALSAVHAAKDTAAEAQAKELVKTLVTCDGLKGDHAHLNLRQAFKIESGGTEDSHITVAWPSTAKQATLPSSQCHAQFDSLAAARRVLKLDRWKTKSFGADVMPLEAAKEFLAQADMEPARWLVMKRSVASKTIRHMMKLNVAQHDPESSSRAAWPNTTKALGNALSAALVDAKKLPIEPSARELEEWSDEYVEHFESLEVVTKAALLMMRIYVSLDVASLATSPVHGRGVFVTRDVAPREIVTLFPVSYFRVNAGNETHGEKWVQASYPAAQSRWSDGRLTRAQMDEAHSTALEVPSAGLTVGASPDEDYSPAYLGHFVNDAAALSGAADVAQYHAASSKGANVAPVQLAGGTVIALVAITHIAAGSEVFYFYGAEAWLREYRRKQAEEPTQNKAERACASESEGDRRARR